MYPPDDNPSPANGASPSAKDKTHKTSDDDDAFDLDDLLPIVGEFGRYQKKLLWLVCLPACLPCGFCAFNQLFMASTPPHWCRVPGLEGLDPSRRRRLAIPTTQQVLNFTKFVAIKTSSWWPRSNKTGKSQGTVRESGKSQGKK